MKNFNWLVETLFKTNLVADLDTFKTFLIPFMPQAHAQARFVIAQVLLEMGDGLVSVTEPVANEKLLITLDREKLQTVGRAAIEDFLLKLQVSRFSSLAFPPLLPSS